jgi:hypothetical protein
MWRGKRAVGVGLVAVTAPNFAAGNYFEPVATTD